MSLLLNQLIQKLKEENDFVGVHKDKKSGKETLYENYSLTIQAFASWIDQIQQEFPQFKISRLFLDYYIVGFGKKIASQEDLRKRLSTIEQPGNIISSNPPIQGEKPPKRGIFEKLFSWIKRQRR